MFIGHFGVGLAAKKAAPRISLGTLFLACQFLDLLWPVLVLAGVETVSVEPGATKFNALNFESYPFSHSLLTTLVWSIVLGSLYFAFTRRRRDAAVVGTVVMSHWILDFVVHRADLPLGLGSSMKVGLGLWNSVVVTLILECGIFFGGVYLYLKINPLNDLRSKLKFWSLITFLFLVYFASAFGPQPQEGTPASAIAGPALAMWLIVVWAYWVDRRPKVHPNLPA